ncbi:MAG: ATP-binding protein [Gammaproteobacteria bacterium]|nr:ATP-binding protein [Gammaproteobacteria bacterium]MYL14493.1 ATP-binding protein [Gammaproteobacteria bacterium]
MLNAYESYLLQTCLVNIAAGVDRRSPEAEGLVEWMAAEWPKHEYACNVKASETKLHDSRNLRKYRRKVNRQRDKKTPVNAKTLENVRESLQTALPTRAPSADRTARRLRRLGKATGLSALDREVLELLLRYATHYAFESLIDDIFDRPGPRMNQLHVSGYVMSILLGRRPRSIQSRLGSNSPLVRSGLVQIDRDGDLDVPCWLLRLVNEPGNNTTDIMRILFDSASASELEWSDFDHIAKHRDHIETLLKGALESRAKGVNILLYGTPGTGKTEFCKVLAERLGVTLYAAGEADDDGFEPSRKDRQQELIVAQRLLANDSNSLLLFDEMEDLLGDTLDLAAIFGPKIGTGHRQGESKVFMHRLLEETPVPILWTMNDALSVSPTILRRMMFALELRKPDASIRERVWVRQLERNNIAAAPNEVRELAREFDATPALAAGATAAARIGDGSLDTVRFGVRSLSKLLGSNKPPQQAPAEFELDLIRADTDPELLAGRIVSTARRDFSLCLQGPPGTGKSAFARYLAERLGLEVIHKRASDLKSMWVGQTERLIAGAFAEARDAEAFLIFDEADSLLSDRRRAERSWEVSQVNEMLTWMESHPLPFACTTNFVDRLDEATLRRFTFKIGLDYLTAEQARFAFGKFFALEPPTGLNLISGLTPGDFAVVRKKADVLGCLGEPDTLAAMLRAECDAKPNRPKSIGFLG